MVLGVVVVVIAGFLLARSQSPDNTPEISEEVPINTDETENRLEEVLGRTLPEDAERAALKDTTGSGFTGIATRAEDNGVVEFTILADLSDPGDGVYQVWAGESADKLTSLGTLTSAKGGYLFEYRQSGSLEDYNSVVIKMGEDTILQGSF